MCCVFWAELRMDYLIGPFDRGVYSGSARSACIATIWVVYVKRTPFQHHSRSPALESNRCPCRCAQQASWLKSLGALSAVIYAVVCALNWGFHALWLIHMVKDGTLTCMLMCEYLKDSARPFGVCWWVFLLLCLPPVSYSFHASHGYSGVWLEFRSPSPT